MRVFVVVYWAGHPHIASAHRSELKSWENPCRYATNLFRWGLDFPTGAVWLIIHGTARVSYWVLFGGVPVSTSIVSGSLSAWTDTPLCRPSAQTPCTFTVNSIRLNVGSFSVGNVSISQLTVGPDFRKRKLHGQRLGMDRELPASTFRAIPVIQRASALARNSAAQAMSHAVP